MKATPEVSPFFVYNLRMNSQYCRGWGTLCSSCILAACLLLGQRMLNLDSDLGRHLVLGRYMLDSQHGSHPRHALIHPCRTSPDRPTSGSPKLCSPWPSVSWVSTASCYWPASVIAAAFLVVFVDARAAGRWCLAGTRSHDLGSGSLQPALAHAAARLLFPLPGDLAAALGPTSAGRRTHALAAAARHVALGELPWRIRVRVHCVGSLCARLDHAAPACRLSSGQRPSPGRGGCYLARCEHADARTGWHLARGAQQYEPIRPCKDR